MFEVLLVDDSAAVRMDIRRMGIWGAESGFQIAAEAENGCEAIDLLQKRGFDLVITDIRMPKVDGIGLLKNIRENNSEAHVALLSDFSEFEYAKNGILYGAFEYLVKPLQEIELSQLLFRVGEDLQKNRDKFSEGSVALINDEAEVKKIYDTLNVKNLTAYICNADDKAVEMAISLPGMLLGILGNNQVLIVNFLNEILDNVAESINLKYPWIRNYPVLKLLEHINYRETFDLDLLEKHMSDCFDKLLQFLKCFLRGKDEESIERKICCSVLESDYAEMHLQPIADKLYISPSHLSGIFNRKTGVAFKDYLLMVRMERAKYLASLGKLKNYEIAELLGYNDAEYFCRLFHDYCGVKLSDYKKNYHFN